MLLDRIQEIKFERSISLDKFSKLDINEHHQASSESLVSLRLLMPVIHR